MLGGGFAFVQRLVYMGTDIVLRGQGDKGSGPRLRQRVAGAVARLKLAKCLPVAVRGLLHHGCYGEIVA